tara:strand:+ start:543 stop:740 length:198 start_codon:yes stop_codon:yes gene_type:complete
MKNLTTPQAILCGLGLIALAIASVPYSSSPAIAASPDVTKIAICTESGINCVQIDKWGELRTRIK